MNSGLPGVLSDHQMFRGLINYLKKSANEKKTFFYCHVYHRNSLYANLPPMVNHLEV